MTVQTLLHHGGVPMALRAFATLRTALGGTLPPLQIHDDGSLTDADVALLHERLAGARVLRRAEADERVAPHLARRPRLQAYRARFAFGLKLVDAALLAPGPTLRYLDGDFVFLRRVDRLFPGDGTSCALLEPTQTCMSASNRALLRRGVRYVPHCNAGLLQIERRAHDLDFAEWFLSKADLNGIPIFAEQTCYAALLARARALSWDPAQVLCHTGAADAAGDAAAVHVFSPIRGRFDELAALAERQASTSPVVALRFQPAPTFGRREAVAGALRRLLRR